MDGYVAGTNNKKALNYVEGLPDPKWSAEYFDGSYSG
jgi:hypothetical protein